MTTKLEQAARQALGALEVWSDASASLKGQEAITALREALAEQAEQSQLADASLEPVGYFAYDEEHDIWEEMTGPNAPGATKLYAAPVRTKDLTDDEVAKAYMECTGGDIIARCRAVIAADREKNK